MRRVLAITFFLCAPAAAQNTNCQLYGNSMNCQTTQPSQGIDWNLAAPNDFDAGAAMQQAQNNVYRREQAERSESQEQQARVTAQHAGALVAAGKCDEARAFALRVGDFQLARDIMSACAK